MKGDVGISFITVILIVGVVAIILSVMGISTGSNFSENTASRFEVRYTVLTMQNALKGAGIYMKTGGRYSLYQAAYDVFRQGGFEEPGEGGSFNYWYDSFQAVTIPSADGFMSSISSLTEEYVNRYASAGYNFMRSFSIVIPKYEVNLASDEVLNTVRISANSSGRMVLAKTQSTGEQSSIEKTANFTDNMTINLRGLYDRAAGLSISGIVTEIENGMKAISLPSSCPDSYTASTEAEKQRIKDAIMAIRLSAPQETGDYSFEMSMVHADTKRSPGTTCSHTLMGVAKVNVTAKNVLLPVLNEDGPNFAPAELIFLVRHAFTSTGEKPTSDNLEISPSEDDASHMYVPAPYIPEPPPPSTGIIEFGEMTKACKNNRNYDAYIAEASQMFGLDVSLIRAVICAESDFNPRALSVDGAVGLMQVMPSTFKGVDKQGNPTGLYYDNYCEGRVGGESQWRAMMKSVSHPNDPIWDPRVNIMAGTCYLSKIYYTQGSIQGMDTTSKVRCMLAGYNGGPGRIDEVVRGYGEWAKTNCDPSTSNMPDETRNYVAKITDWAGIATA